MTILTNEIIKQLLKENKIHKSFANIFSLCDEINTVHTLIKSFLFFDKNKTILNYTECDFREYFSEFTFIKTIDIELYNESCDLILLENKTTSYINRTIKKEYRTLAFSHENYNLCLYLVKEGISLDAFKAYMSNIQHINTHSILFRSLNRMLLEHHNWKGSFKDCITEFQDIPDHNYLIQEKKELLFFAGDDFDVHSQIGAPNWCSTQAHDYYHFSLNFMEKIYFHFDFNKEYYDPLSLIAILTDEQDNIIQVFDKFNNEINNDHIKSEFKEIIKEKGYKYKSSITKETDELTKSFHAFKNNNHVDTLRHLDEYKHNQSKSVYYYFFLLPKILYLFSAKELESYFKLLKEHNAYILSPNLEMYNSLEDFEIGCIRNSNIKIAYRYLTEGDSKLLKGKNKNQFIKFFEQKKMLTPKDLVTTFWNLFLHSKDKTAKKDFLSIFQDIVTAISEGYSDKEIRAIFINYINFYKMSDEYMRVQFIHRLVALAYIDMSSSESFSSNEFYLMIENIKSLFEESNCSIMKYKIEEDVLFNMINAIDRNNSDMLKAFTLFLFENYSISFILKNHFVIDNSILELILNNKNDFSWSLKKRLKELKIDFSFLEKKDISLIVVHSLFTTLSQNEIEEVLKDTECPKTQQLYIDLISNIK